MSRSSSSGSWWVRLFLETSLDEILSLVLRVVKDPRTFEIMGELIKYFVVAGSAIGYILCISSAGIALSIHQYYTGFDFALLKKSTAPTFLTITLLLTLTHWTCLAFTNNQLKKIWPSLSDEYAEREEEKTRAYRLKIVDNKPDTVPLYMSVSRKDIIKERGPLGLFVKNEGFTVAATVLDETKSDSYLFQREKFGDCVLIRSLETNSLLTLLKQDNTFIIQVFKKILSIIGCAKRRSPAGVLSVLNPKAWSGQGIVKATERERFVLKPHHEEKGAYSLFNPHFNVFIRVRRNGKDVQYVGSTKPTAATPFLLEHVKKKYNKDAQEAQQKVKEVKEATEEVQEVKEATEEVQEAQEVPTL